MSLLPEDFIPPVPTRRLTTRSTDGVRLAVQVHGAPGDPTVVLAHGWTLSAAYWSRVIRRLRPDLQVVAYDQRGHGHSSAVPPGGFRIDALADDLAAVLIATVPAGERAVLAGHSMGAMALVALAARHPDLLHATAAGAALISTGVEQLLTRARILPLPRPAPDDDAPDDTPLRTLVEELTRRSLSDPWLLQRIPVPILRAAIAHLALSRTASAAEREWTTDVIRACPPATTAGFATMLGLLDLSIDVTRLDVPTVVLVGSADRLTPPWHAYRLAATAPRVVGLVEVQGVGHMTPLQSPDAVADAIRQLSAGCLSTGPGEEGPGEPESGEGPLSVGAAVPGPLLEVRAARHVTAAVQGQPVGDVEDPEPGREIEGDPE